jgi:dnd system-associated protein 4
VSDYRVRRPADKETLIARLQGEDIKLFPTLKDVLVFAAALGRARERPASFTATGESIRLEVFTKDAGVELFMQALAVLAYPEDPQVLAESRTGDRIRVFEEYANGGLEILQGMLNARQQVGDDDTIHALVAEALQVGIPAPEEPDLTAFADELFQ